MRFAKWQALGNDYVIVERRNLPRSLTPAQIRGICAPHTGVGADGVLVLSESDDPRFVAGRQLPARRQHVAAPQRVRVPAFERMGGAHLYAVPPSGNG